MCHHGSWVRQHWNWSWNRKAVHSYEGNFIVWQTFHRWVYSKWVYVHISTGSRATTIHESGTSCTNAKSNDLSLILSSTYLVWIQNIVNKLVFANASSYSKLVKLLQGIRMTSQFHNLSLLIFFFLTCVSLTNYLISKKQLPYIGVIFAIVQ